MSSSTWRRSSPARPSLISTRVSHQLDGTRMPFDAIRLAGGGYKPRVVFTSSIAVFGAPFPDAIGDEFFQTPLFELRHPEGDRGAPARRLLASRVPWTALASGCRTICIPSRSAQQGGFRVLSTFCASHSR